MKQIILLLLFSNSVSVIALAQEYFPYYSLPSEKAREYFDIDRETLSDTLPIINAINVLGKTDYIQKKQIISLPVKNKKNRSQYDSLVRYRDSVSQRYYGQQRVKDEAISLIVAERFFYNNLKGYTAQLIHALWPALFEDSYLQKDKIIILGLLDLPDSIRMPILSYKNTPAFVKARLGHDRSETEIVQAFGEVLEDSVIDSEGVDIDQFESNAEQLLYIRSPKALKTYFDALQSRTVFFKTYRKGRDFEACETCPETVRLEWSLASVLIEKLSVFQPYMLIRSRLHTVYEGLFESEEEGLQNYFSDVEELVKTKYQLDIKIEAPFITNGQFVQPKNFEY